MYRGSHPDQRAADDCLPFSFVNGLGTKRHSVGVTVDFIDICTEICGQMAPSEHLSQTFNTLQRRFYGFPGVGSMT